MRLLAAFLFVALLWLPPRPAAAEPAMWSVTDADSTLYLFGTIHILRPETQWRSAALESALQASEEVWLESPIDDDPLEARDLVLKYGIDRSVPLNRKLSILERRQLGAALTAIRMPSVAVQLYRPWLAAVTLVYAPAIQAGYDISLGADRQVKASAVAAGKPVNAFETFEQQIRFFATMPPTVELDFLRRVLGDFAEGEARIEELMTAWSKGDVAALREIVERDIKVPTPQLHHILIRQRNNAWLERIEQLMAGSGTHFVAVGAAHLVGADGLPEQLTQRGFTVTRQQ